LLVLPKYSYYTVRVGNYPNGRQPGRPQAALLTCLPPNPSDDGSSCRNASGFPLRTGPPRPPLATDHSPAAHLPIPYGCGPPILNCHRLLPNNYRNQRAHRASDLTPLQLPPVEYPPAPPPCKTRHKYTVRTLQGGVCIDHTPSP
jgi:hypothetical protein